MDVEEFKDDVRQGRTGSSNCSPHSSGSRQETRQELEQTRKEREQAREQIAELQRQLGYSQKPRVAEPYSMRSEEERQAKRQKKKHRKRKSRSSGRTTTAEKIAQAERTEQVFPDGVPREKCSHSHTHVVWRLENGRAVRVAYEVYRAGNRYGQIPGAAGRSEFGMEILLCVAYQVFVVGLSFDKVCQLMNFMEDLQLKKSQVDALLNQLARHWEGEFETLCTLLAYSAIVHADETSWSINSVWAFLSEKARLLFFGGAQGRRHAGADPRSGELRRARY